MAIDPESISTLRTGQLPPFAFTLASKIAHEVGTDLNYGTVEQLAETIAAYIGATDSIAFNPVTVLDGQTLPDTTVAEWILVGIGTFTNVNGGANITTTEELNALISNGTTWSIGVEIPINVDPVAIGISQTVNGGITNFAPSEDAVRAAIDEATFLNGGQVSYVSYAFTAETSVILVHNFGKFPIVQVIDDTGNQIIPLSINHTSINSVTVTFSSATTGTLIGSMGSPQLSNYTSKTSNYTILESDGIIDCLSDTFTVTLPTAVGVESAKYTIKNSGSGIITLATTSSQTIDGELTQELIQYDAIEVMSNNTNWIII